MKCNKLEFSGCLFIALSFVILLKMAYGATNPKTDCILQCEAGTSSKLQLATKQATRTLTASKDIEAAALGAGAAKEVTTPPARGD